MKLNKEQQSAVDHIKGPLRVVAGPGSGKTRLIIQKIVKIRNENLADESEIVVITFTNKAVNEIKKRLKSEGVENVRVMTYHSFCRRIIDLFGHLIGVKY